jgi:hypothetical protein
MEGSYALQICDAFLSARHSNGVSIDQNLKDPALRPITSAIIVFEEKDRPMPKGPWREMSVE